MKKLLFLFLLLPQLAMAQYGDVDRYADVQFSIMSFISRHPVITLIILLVVFLIKVFIVRAIFSIPKIEHHLTAQTKLLAMMAEKQGIDRKAINRVVEEERERNSKNPFDIK